jgi:hypothetical protein
MAFVGSSLLSALTGRSSYKIYNALSPVLSEVPGLKIKSASAANQADMPQHPTEDGVFLADHKIILPRVIQVEGFCINHDTYNKMQQLFNDRTNLFGIQIKEVIVENCSFGEFVPVRDSKVLNAIPVSFTLHEILQSSAKSGMSKNKVKSPNDADTVKRGQTQTAMPPADQARVMIASGIR